MPRWSCGPVHVGVGAGGWPPQRRAVVCPQAGGVGEQGLQDSILETPVYVLAFVFFCFMALSIMFEYVRSSHNQNTPHTKLPAANSTMKCPPARLPQIVHFLQHLCQHKGRPGMGELGAPAVLWLRRVPRPLIS